MAKRTCPMIILTDGEHFEEAEQNLRFIFGSGQIFNIHNTALNNCLAITQSILGDPGTMVMFYKLDLCGDSACDFYLEFVASNWHEAIIIPPNRCSDNDELSRKLIDLKNAPHRRPNLRSKYHKLRSKV